MRATYSYPTPPFSGLLPSLELPFAELIRVSPRVQGK